MAKLSPAEFVTYKFGGTRATGRLLGISHNAVVMWKRTGNIPEGRYQQILKIAKKQKVSITPKNLVLGGSTTQKGK